MFLRNNYFITRVIEQSLDVKLRFVCVKIGLIHEIKKKKRI